RDDGLRGAGCAYAATAPTPGPHHHLVLRRRRSSGHGRGHHRDGGQPHRPAHRDDGERERPRRELEPDDGGACAWRAGQAVDGHLGCGRHRAGTRHRAGRDCEQHAHGAGECCAAAAATAAA
ncbi:MAG: hypothetical protein ACK5QX_03885, partial [bacterium]